MYQGYKVVAVTLAGRRRYLELLTAYSLAQRPLVDQHQLWVNTTDPEDLAYLQNLAAQHPDFFRLVKAGVPIEDLFAIPHFYCRAVDPSTLYIKLDDDIVYLAPWALERLLAGRLRHPQAPIVVANTVNNALCTYLHQRRGVIGLEHGQLLYDAFERLAFSEPHYAELVHRSFLAHPRRDEAFTFSDWRLCGFERICINCICWFGRDLAAWGGQVPVGDEGWFSEQLPRQLGQPNWIIGDAVVAHFAFRTQREYLDTTDLLEQYRRLLPQRLGPRHAPGPPVFWTLPLAPRPQ